VEVTCAENLKAETTISLHTNFFGNTFLGHLYFLRTKSRTTNIRKRERDPAPLYLTRLAASQMMSLPSTAEVENEV